MKTKYNLFTSKCCGAEAIIEMHPDFYGDDPKTIKMGTCSFVCEKCGKPCDIKPIKREKVV